MTNGRLQQQQQQSPFFRLPLEIRRQIYIELLTSPTPINNSHELIGKQRRRNRKTKRPDAPTPQNGLDATILRTCHPIYIEALPVLYETNTFGFMCPYAMARFQLSGLDPERLANKTQRPQAPEGLHTFGFEFTAQGRLTLIRILKLEVSTGWLRPTRELLWNSWEDFVMDEGMHAIRFPNLRMLSLDFSVWELGDDEGELLDPLIERFQNLRDCGVEKLVIKGVKHQPTLDKMRQDIVKEGGHFTVED